MLTNMRDGRFVSLTLAERFAGKYSVDETTGCWNWNSLTRKGYGYLKSGNSKKLSAHRVSWELHHGEIPDGLWVLHRCDNPQCVNPDHLFVGTAKDNNEDMMSKGRQKLNNSGNWQAGEKHRKSKLSSEAVAIIREKRMRPTDYSKIYGISVSTVCNIQAGRTWNADNHMGSHP